MADVEMTTVKSETTETDIKPASDAAMEESDVKPVVEGEEQAAGEGEGEGEGEGSDDRVSSLTSKLQATKLSNDVAGRLAGLIVELGLDDDDFDERAIDLLSTFSGEQTTFILKEIADSQLYGVQNRAQFLMAVMRNFKDRVRSMGPAASMSVPLIPGPKVEDIKSIVERTGYHLEVTVGQRKYHCPEHLVKEPTGNDHEVYIGQIPRDVYEDALIPVFEQVGQIWDLRVMMDALNGKTRGYAFLVYVNRDHANEAAKKFNGYEIVPGKQLKVNVSIANTRLFIGNIPKSKSKEEILDEMRKHAENVADVIVYVNPDAGDNKKNRGFCFVDFADHKSASDAKRRISTFKVRPWNCELVVDWADQQDEPDEETMAHVKVLYVKNLKECVTEETLNELFKEFGEVERTKKIRDYAFVHFKERDDAVKAMEAMKGKQIEGVDVEISLAKPQGDQKQRRPKTALTPGKRGPSFPNRGGGPRNQGPGGYGDYYGPQGRTPRGGANGVGGAGGYGPPKYPHYPPQGYPPSYDMYPGYTYGPYGAYDPYAYPPDPYYSGPYGGAAPRGGPGYSRGGGRGGARGGGNPIGGNRNNPRGRGGGPGRGSKRPGDGQGGGPASKRGGRADDFTADIPMNSY